MYRGPRGNHPIEKLVVHVNVGPEVQRGAQGLSIYLNNNGPKGGGYHVIEDDAHTVIQAANDVLVYGAGMMNTNGKHHCLIGSADQSAAQWADAYSKGELTQAAKAIAKDCRELRIPPRHLSVAEVGLSGIKGICGHDDVSANWPVANEGHYDPGPHFPWADFLRLVNFFVAPPAPPTPSGGIVAGMTIGLNQLDRKTGRERFVDVHPEQNGILCYNGSRLKGDTGHTPFGCWKWFGKTQADKPNGKFRGGELSKDGKFVQIMFSDGGVFNFEITSKSDA